ncbi:ESX secretion-associated protein EspG [Rhodococcus rhodochrous]|uniref:ESX secretion-associated protein EspG n=1 Tax=Rhodococcus rhodochrous TaxID=1829 RepID=UPI0003698407|nr:ESX secretion-associated protein EspG [Rhodococcus rhodochrous]MCR8694684.1 ESX secretion-associated protein EspG [Rhodococcus pyridinivorans]
MDRYLTPDRFLASWTAAGGDEFPFPLRYRTSAMWEDEHAANMQAARAWLHETPDPALDDAMRILLTGEVAVEVYGRSTDPSCEVFVRAAATDEQTVLACQAPAAGDIRITTTTDLAGAIVGHLPVVAPGREPARTAPSRDVLEPSEFGAVRRPAGGTHAESLRRLLRRERSATGSIRILRYSNPGYTPVADIGWFDVVGDGRYLFVPGPDLRVAPGTVGAFVRELSAQLSRMRRPSHEGRSGVLRHQ